MEFPKPHFDHSDHAFCVEQIAILEARAEKAEKEIVRLKAIITAMSAI